MDVKSAALCDRCNTLPQRADVIMASLESFGTECCNSQRSESRFSPCAAFIPSRRS